MLFLARSSVARPIRRILSECATRSISIRGGGAGFYTSEQTIVRVLHNRLRLSTINTRKMSSINVPPGFLLEWGLSAEEIGKRTTDLIEKSRKVFEDVGSLPKDEVNVENVLKVLSDNDSHCTCVANMLDFPQHVSPDKTIREASTEADRKLSDFQVEMSMRKDVFDNLVALQEKKDIISSLTPEGIRTLERRIKLGRRNGLHLPQGTQDEIKKIKKRMSDISINFNKYCNDENTVLEFTKDQLAGMPDDFMNSLEKTDDGKLKVSLQYPHYFPVQKKCRIPETRQKLQTAFDSRCMKENAPILEELVELRQKQADLLGYPTHSSFITEMRMSKTAENVSSFLSNLAKKLKPLAEAEMKEFLKFKASESAEHGLNNDGKINMWDFRYYMNMVEERNYGIDHEKIQEYFPMDHVTGGLLEIYQDLLGVKFTLVEKAPVWHSDVSMYTVHDGAELLGYFFLDLFPREGKFSHAACFGLQPGCQLSSTERQVAVAAMVANFTKPTAEKPSLLTHDEVETFFHEFGHVMHSICARTEYVLFSGTRVERDFVEAPSQMLENWVWEKEPLKILSKHYKTGETLPDELIGKMVNARTVNAGIFNLRQITLSTFDQRIHTQAKADTAKIYSDVACEIMGVPATPGTNMSASFAHLADGYDAQYYGYLWSEVYSMDMFYSRFKKEGVMNRKTGRDYRDYILQPGGSVDAKDMLVKFLGREPQQEAFLISKGLKL